jgi:hypothetical protein
MRAYEFISENWKIKHINTEGLSCSDWLTLLENKTHNTLLENLDQSEIDYLDGLESYAVDGIVGEKYVPIFVMLLSNRLTCYGLNHLAELVNIKHVAGLDEYTFKDNMGNFDKWPSSRLSMLSYAKLYLFDNSKNFEEFRTAIAMKFEPIIPEASFK